MLCTMGFVTLGATPLMEGMVGFFVFPLSVSRSFKTSRSPVTAKNATRPRRQAVLTASGNNRTSRMQKTHPALGSPIWKKFFREKQIDHAFERSPPYPPFVAISAVISSSWQTTSSYNPRHSREIVISLW